MLVEQGVLRIAFTGVGPARSCFSGNSAGISTGGNALLRRITGDCCYADTRNMRVPVVSIMPGPLDGTLTGRAACLRCIEVALLLLIGVAMTVLLSLLSPLRATLLTALALAGLAAVILTEWVSANAGSPLASNLLTVASMFALHTSYGYLTETRAKRQITVRSHQHVLPAPVAELSRPLFESILLRFAACRRNPLGDRSDGAHRFEDK
jgi:hypothetical protein